MSYTDIFCAKLLLREWQSSFYAHIFILLRNL